MIKRIYKRINKALVDLLKLNGKIGSIRTNNSYEFEMFGNQSYGGWTIPKNILNENSVCYLVGAGEDISFDCKLANKYTCKVFIFDPTPRAKQHFKNLISAILKNKKMSVNNSETEFYNIPKEKLDLLKYYDYGVWSKTEIKKFFVPPKEKYVSHSIANFSKTKKYFEAQCKTVMDIMEELGHNKIDLLKLDVEGVEYEIIDSIIKDKLKIKILCLEFDETPILSIMGYLRVRKTIKKLLQNNFELIHINESDFTFIKK